MNKQTRQSIRNVLVGILILSLPLIAYPLWDWNTENAKVGDQLRALSSRHEHAHASVWKLEHRRHFEAFDFNVPYQALKPQVEKFCSGPEWRGKDEVDYVEYENIGSGRVNYVRLAKNVDVGLFGDRSALKPGDKGQRPWAVVMYQTSWFDEQFSALSWGLMFFPFSKFFWGSVIFLGASGSVPFLKRRKP